MALIVPEPVIQPGSISMIAQAWHFPRPRLSLPARVLIWQAHGAGTVARGSRGLRVEKEDAVADIASPRDGTERGGAIETAVDATAAVPP